MLSNSQKTALKLFGFNTRPDNLYPSLDWITKNNNDIALRNSHMNWIFTAIATKQDKWVIYKVFGLSDAF
jgi:hypothetical protein